MRHLILAIIVGSFILIASTPAATTDILLNRTVTVAAQRSVAIQFATNADDVHVAIGVEILSGNDISVYLMDTTNFVKWLDGQNATNYFTKERTGDFDAKTTLGDEGTYYAVLDNSHSVTSKRVHIFIGVKPSASVSASAELLFGIIILGIIGGAAFSGFLIWRRRKTPVTPPSGASLSRPAPATPVSAMIYCSNCGARVMLPAKFCNACGEAVNA